MTTDKHQMPSETGNRVSDGILFVISKRGSLNIPTLFFAL
ncbi:hypothetical protein NMA510612_1291 [Neisseria meningitidis]|uniref:Uncharacterized protein n=1 Tax=Neisseria meningitidis TaxID=487 RepID=X5EQ26_NEIME|nr:hypothetical protein NMA510612_1291 [Neisseria meningitidis]